MSLRAATAEIDLSALTTNFQIIKQLAPTSQILAVLKANAYGHGLARIAEALPQADAFGVARIDEALALRANGVTQAIVLLEGFFSEDDITIIVANNLQTVVHNQQQLDVICQATLEKPLKVWLKIDTGMHRLGIEPEDFTTFYQKLTQSNNVQSPLVLMSHLASADDQENPSNEQQISLFTQLAAELPVQKSLANSAGICAWQDTHLNWLRPGLLLYGVSPMHLDHQLSLPIQPVMTLKAHVISVRHIKKGQSVGYGGHWQSQQDTMIGVIAIGYGDGYPRHAPNGTPVLINGNRVSLVGRVSMDMITVDLGADANVKIGDQATLWGRGLPIEEVAKYATTIAYELLCNVSQRVHMTTI